MDIKAEDLITKCKKCGGSGYHKETANETTGAVCLGRVKLLVMSPAAPEVN